VFSTLDAIRLTTRITTRLRCVCLSITHILTSGHQDSETAHVRSYESVVFVYMGLLSRIWTLARKMTSFCFPNTFMSLGLGLIKVSVNVRVRVRGSGNTFKYVFGQTSIRASALDLCFPVPSEEWESIIKVLRF